MSDVAHGVAWAVSSVCGKAPRAPLASRHTRGVCTHSCQPCVCRPAPPPPPPARPTVTSGQVTLRLGECQQYTERYNIFVLRVISALAFVVSKSSVKRGPNCKYEIPPLVPPSPVGSANNVAVTSPDVTRCHGMSQGEIAFAKDRDNVARMS